MFLPLQLIYIFRDIVVFKILLEQIIYLGATKWSELIFSCLQRKNRFVAIGHPEIGPPGRRRSDFDSGYIQSLDKVSFEIDLVVAFIVSGNLFVIQQLFNHRILNHRYIGQLQIGCHLWRRRNTLGDLLESL